MSEEFGPNFITITDEDGNDIELEYVDALEHNGTPTWLFSPQPTLRRRLRAPRISAW